MARRAGKAANRRARQRNVPRAPRPATPTASSSAAQGPVDSRAASEPATPARQPRVQAPPSATVGSSLTLRERAEYHYVERDLRNIGILTAIMALLLLGAWFVFNSLGVI